MNSEAHMSSASTRPHAPNALRTLLRAGPSTSAPGAHPPRPPHRAPHARAHASVLPRRPPLKRASPYPPIASTAWTDAASAIPPDELAFMDACFDFDAFEADNLAHHLERVAKKI